VLKFYPAPTGPGEGPAHLNNYIYPSRWVADMDQWIGRTDFVLNSRNTFYAAKNAATIARQELLLPFPQYAGITHSNIPIGSQGHHGVLTKVTKRFSHGLTFLASYSIGKTLEQVSFLNAQDLVLSDPLASRLEKRSADQIDIPQKFVITGVWEMPFGKRKPIGSDWSRGLDMLLGGWQINWDITYQSGWTIDYPNANQVRPGSAKLGSDKRSFERWFDTSLWDDPATGRRVPAQEAFTLRAFPTRFGDVRVPGYQNWDASLSKYFPVHEQIRFQFRLEMINAFNHPWFPRMQSGGLDVTRAAFGQLDAVQRNLPRFIKLALHLYW